MLLLGSGGFRTPERVAVWAGEMRAALGDRRRVLFVPYALADHSGYVRTMVERGLHAGYDLVGIHDHADPAAAVREAEAIFVGGGNTFRLLDTLYRLNLLDVIRERVRGGMPYLGVSAGTNVAGPTIRTTNDMPIVQPPSLDALGLVPFQINPHYYEGHNYVRVGDAYVQHFGETRDERIKEFHEENATPVIGLWEGGVLRVTGERVEVVGSAARLFRRGSAPWITRRGRRSVPANRQRKLPGGPARPKTYPSKMNALAVRNAGSGIASPPGSLRCRFAGLTSPSHPP